jgi:hypothetical protein
MPARPAALWSVRLLLAVGLAAGALLPDAQAGMFAAAEEPVDGHAVERRVKAAYLYKFASYVEWPAGAFANARSPLVIGVAGDDALRDELRRLVMGRTVGGRNLQVRSVQPGQPVRGLHVLYAGDLSGEERAALRRQLAGRPVLLVSDLQGARALDSMVRFVPVDQRLRFDVDLGPVEAGRLKVSALMLSAARHVERRP